MKHLNRIFVFAAALAMLAGCAKDDAATDRPAYGDCVGFTTNIAPATSTRVGYGNQWEAGDRVGIFMKTAGQTLSTQSALDENKQYSAAGGNLSAVGDGLHYPVKGSVDFVAYYPYTASVVTRGTEFRVPVNISDQGIAANRVFLWSQNAKDKSNSPEAVALQFTHQFSRVKLTITAGDGFPAEELKNLTVSLTNVPLSGEFNPVAGAFDNGGSVGDVVMFPGGTESEPAYNQRHITVLPMAGSGRRITFTHPELSLGDYTIPDDKVFEKARIHSYKVTINRDGVEVTVGNTVDWSIKNVNGSFYQEPEVTLGEIAADKVSAVNARFGAWFSDPDEFMNGDPTPMFIEWREKAEEGQEPDAWSAMEVSAVADDKTTEYVLGDLDPATEYEVRVRVVIGGCDYYSDTDGFTTLELGAVTIAGASENPHIVNLVGTLVNHSDDTRQIAHVAIMRSLTGEEDSYVEAGTVPAEDLVVDAENPRAFSYTYTDTRLEEDTEYHYRAELYYKDGENAPQLAAVSEPAKIKTEAIPDIIGAVVITEVRTTPSAYKLALGGTVNNYSYGYEREIAELRMLRSTTGGDDYAHVYTIPASALTLVDTDAYTFSWQDEGLQPDTRYWYKAELWYKSATEPDEVELITTSAVKDSTTGKVAKIVVTDVTAPDQYSMRVTLTVEKTPELTGETISILRSVGGESNYLLVDLQQVSATVDPTNANKTTYVFEDYLVTPGTAYFYKAAVSKDGTQHDESTGRSGATPAIGTMTLTPTPSGSSSPGGDAVVNIDATISTPGDYTGAEIDILYAVGGGEFGLFETVAATAAGSCDRALPVGTGRIPALASVSFKVEAYITNSEQGRVKIAESQSMSVTTPPMLTTFTTSALLEGNDVVEVTGSYSTVSQTPNNLTVSIYRDNIKIADVASTAGAFSYTDDAPIPEATHVYTASVTPASGYKFDSTPSAAISIPAAGAVTLTGNVVGPMKISLSGTITNDTSKSVERAIVMRKDPGGASFNIVGEAALTSTGVNSYTFTFEDTAINPSTRYEYIVSVHSDSGELFHSADNPALALTTTAFTGSATLTPTAVITTSERGEFSISGSLNDQNSGLDVTSVKIISVGSPAFTEQSATLTGNDFTATLTNLSPYTQYTMKAVVTLANGLPNGYTFMSESVSATTHPVIKDSTFVSSATASWFTSNLIIYKINFQYDGSGPDSPAVQILRSTDNLTFEPIITVPTTRAFVTTDDIEYIEYRATYNDTDVESGTRYYYKARLLMSESSETVFFETPRSASDTAG